MEDFAIAMVELEQHGTQPPALHSRILAPDSHQEGIVMAEYTSLKSASVVLANLGNLLPNLEPLYKDIHAHPELSMHETRTERSA